jgi:hypothetical protein
MVTIPFSTLINACTFWLESIKSNSALHAYTIHLSLFSKFHNTNPDQLVQLNTGQLKTMILNYIIHLKSKAKKYAGKPKTGELSVNSIKHLPGFASIGIVFVIL